MESPNHLKLWYDMIRSALEIPLSQQCGGWREESEKEDSCLLQVPRRGSRRPELE